MQKKIRLLPKEHIEKRLKAEGYYLIHDNVRAQTYTQDWRKRLFHLIIKGGRNKITLNLHYDPPDHFSFPRIAHSRHFGEDIKKELNRIVSACLRE